MTTLSEGKRKRGSEESAEEEHDAESPQKKVDVEQLVVMVSSFQRLHSV